MSPLAPLLAFLLGFGSTSPLPVPPPAPPPAPEPATLAIEVRVRDVPPGEADAAALPSERAPGRLLSRGTITTIAGEARYRTGGRIPIVTYSFTREGWTANTSFQDCGVQANLKEIVGRADRGRVMIQYDCSVTSVLDVVAGSRTPILGHATWTGVTAVGPGMPLDLRALTRVDGRLLPLPRNHPLYDGEEPRQPVDRVVEIRMTIEVVTAAQRPQKL